MVPIDQLEQLLVLIVNNPEQALVAIEGLKIAGELTKEQFKIISKKFQEAQKLRKFGFTPAKELANKLISIDSTPAYKKLKKLIGTKHPTLRLVRLGLYIETLNKQGRTDLVEKIRSEIFDNFGEQGFKILDIGSSGLMNEVIETLDNLKKEYDLPEQVLMDRYTYIIARMQFLCVYINNEDLNANIKLKIQKK
ncbi:MAG: hypothetical protein WC758_01580 [Candidatus Woesearchaeota archaeon]